MTRTEFYNLTPSQQQRERLKRYAEYFNSQDKTKQDEIQILPGIHNH